MKLPHRLGLLLGLILSLNPAFGQFTQQGPKLVGPTGGFTFQGDSVALSADGNTAIAGGRGDSGGLGAALVWIRSGGVWIQQGNKLVGSGAAGSSAQGASVSLSGDGNTAIVGGPGDNGGAGAAWVFTRSGGVWTQQGSKLVGSGATGTARQGTAVSISADGNTAMVGGPTDNSFAGAAWVWIRNAGVWTQQGSKLVGSGATGNAGQGSVSLAADGNTAIVGGGSDNSGHGAAWIWTRSGVAWTQQGNKLVGSAAIGAGRQGDSVGLSGDGNTAIIGGPYDDNSTGAAWVWIKSAGIWTQQSSKVVGSGAVGSAVQGFSVFLSSDGNTAIVGGPSDNFDICCLGEGFAGTGASWVWTRSGGAWTQLGAKLVGSDGRAAGQGYSVCISGAGDTAITGGQNEGAAWVFVTGAALVPALGSFATVILLMFIALVALFRLR